jgi:hypothetical protein
MEAMVEAAPGQVPITLSLDDLRAAVAGGRMNPLCRASLDRGATWGAAWQVAGLPPPKQMQDDPAVRMLIPVGRSGWAIAAGYVAIPTMIADLVWLPFALGAPAKASEFAAAGAISLLFLGLPQLALAFVAQRAIRRDPSKHGMGRVGFAYVCVGVLVLAILIGVARGLAG